MDFPAGNGLNGFCELAIKIVFPEVVLPDAMQDKYSAGVDRVIDLGESAAGAKQEKGHYQRPQLEAATSGLAHVTQAME